MGLFYTINKWYDDDWGEEDNVDIEVNGPIKNAQGLLGNETSGRLTDSGIVLPFSATMKALFRFVMLHCGHATTYDEFLSATGKALGLAPLVRGLRQIASRTPSDEEKKKEDTDRDKGAGEDNNSELFVAKGSDRKRALDERNDESAAEERDPYRSWLRIREYEG